MSEQKAKELEQAPSFMERMQKRGIPTLIGGVGVAIITVVAHIWVRDWYSPDVRYEELAYYRTDKEVVASLKLHNYGGSSANDVAIAATFPKPISKQPSTSSEAYSFTPVRFESGRDSISGTIKRIDPGQTIQVFFVLDSPVLPANNTGFVTEITYEGGKGRVGPPTNWLDRLLVNFGATLVVTVLSIYLMSNLTKYSSEAIRTTRKQFSDALERATALLGRAVDQNERLVSTNERLVSTNEELSSALEAERKQKEGLQARLESMKVRNDEPPNEEPKRPRGRQAKGN